MSLWIKIFIAFFIAAIIGGGAVVYKGVSLERRISIPSRDISFFKQIQRLVTKGDDQEVPRDMNILLLGVAGKGHDGSELTDTIVILMIRPQQKRVALLSIPRDLYVKVPDLNIGYSRVNAVYTFGNQYKYETGGIGLLKKTIKEVTGVPIDNYVLMDFEGFVDLVDTLGGIEVDNKEDIYDTAYPGPNFTYQTFKLKKGGHLLDGQTALKYVRTRHSAEGDFGRARRQQEALQVIRTKIFDLNPIFELDKISQIMDTLGEHIKTDLAIDEMKTLYDIHKEEPLVTSAVIDANPETGVVIESKEPLGNAVADVLKPRLGNDNYIEIQDMITHIFDLEQWKTIQKQLREETSSIEIRYSPQDFESKIANNLANELIRFGYQTTLKSIKISELPQETIIYDFSKGAKSASLDDLKNKLSAKTSIATEKITSNADFVVIIKNTK